MTWLRLAFVCLAAALPSLAAADSSSDINKLLRRTPATDLPGVDAGSSRPPPTATEPDAVEGGAEKASQADREPAGEPKSSSVLSKAQLNELVTAATALIIAFKDDKPNSIGSGFSLGGALLLTNSHVVEDADSFLVVTAQGERISAKTIAVGDSKAGRDLAVLELETPIGRTGLSFTTNHPPLTAVYSFGFPWIAMRGSLNWKAIISGDQKVLPGIVASSGSVQQVVENDKNLTVVMHSAKIAGGNSGGPLVDACGRVVGINTYTHTDTAPVLTAEGDQLMTSNGRQETAVVAQVDSGYGFSISSYEIEKYLKARSIKIDMTAEACSDGAGK